MPDILVRHATSMDLKDALSIYNQGIEDRIATLEVEPKDMDYMESWYSGHSERYSVLVAVKGDVIVGWASLNKYSSRSAYDGVADLSIYIERDHRGQGIGSILLAALEVAAVQNGFYKIVLYTFPFNGLGQGLYRKHGYREVGLFTKQGIIDSKFVDVMAMEKLLGI
ncbi:arsinothricin resistance N-acetyltransferase ArsN1 [Paenibacillus glycanilyticus]|uniref:arsinothricin resistance N-acetyltransferase ArsN1 family A n=1 Tax=Paenibacillus glycanilyticus TaxID=126569 RepID=UPI00204223E8|nr:arsinothricin resistance N-acetyltransferase ArsN1 family A [Paenibacillus glycanilyticus]MCM3630001.1 arsinothricin resistance N-acetyltransferase ArsN1 [Paenibacillus glycanilyticus]